MSESGRQKGNATGVRAAAFALAGLLLALPGTVPAQAPPGPAFASAQLNLPDAPDFVAAQQNPREAPGALHGSVQDPEGSLVPGATVTLEDGRGHRHTVETDEAGDFELLELRPGTWTLTVAAPGLRTRTETIDIPAGETLELDALTLKLAADTSVSVTATRDELAEAQVALEEKQRVLGIFPNYYVTYAGEAVPMRPRQKFSLALRLEIDPVTLALDAVTAGVEQASNAFDGYGQGAAGFAKRFGASVADSVDSTFITGAILPTLLHQDPRYFWNGHGTVRHRTLYAIAQVVVCRGDNGHWQPNYSNVGGNILAAGISNLYYPASNRHGATLTIDNALLGTAEGAIGNIIQEFLIHHITPNLPAYEDGRPTTP